MIRVVDLESLMTRFTEKRLWNPTQNSIEALKEVINELIFDPNENNDERV